MNSRQILVQNQEVPAMIKFQALSYSFRHNKTKRHLSGAKEQVAFQVSAD